MGVLALSLVFHRAQFASFPEPSLVPSVLALMIVLTVVVGGSEKEFFNYSLGINRTPTLE